MSQFQNDIREFNTMYRFPVNDVPTNLGEQRLKDFKDILTEELNEIDEIVQLAWEIQWMSADPKRAELELQLFTKLADLLGDLQVFCASEMLKWGLPLDDTLDIIMQSNFSKMGADGTPEYDERGKLLKGPNYWKPEPKISEMLNAILNPPPAAAPATIFSVLQEGTGWTEIMRVSEEGKNTWHPDAAAMLADDSFWKQPGQGSLRAIARTLYQVEFPEG